MSHCSYVYITIRHKKVNTVFKCFVNSKLVKKCYRIPVARIGAKNRRPASASDADRSGT